MLIKYIMVEFDSIIQVIEGLSPAAYSAGDSIVSYTGSKSAKIPFSVNVFKFFFIIIVLSYIGYLYLYKKERYRTSDNLIDLVVLTIALTLTCFALYFSYQNVKKENAKALQEETNK